MPIFEYECAACGRTFENLHARASDGPPQCHHCGADDVKRKLSVFAVTRPGTQPPSGPCGSAECACRRPS